MKKVAIIYWSKGGNVETLANIISDKLEESGVEVNLKQVSDADISDISEADAIALGSLSLIHI